MAGSLISVETTTFCEHPRILYAALSAKPLLRVPVEIPMPIQVFVPKDGLQGQAIPGHVLWGDQTVQSVTVRGTAEFTDLDAFNVDPSASSKEGRTWTLRGFQRPGYVGFVLKTRRIDSLDSTATVQISIEEGGQVHDYSFPVRLFRPSLSIEQPPAVIRIDAKGQTNERIRLRHEGHGTLFVTVNTVEDSLIKSVIPEELLHAVKGFAEDFQKGLEELRPKYPHHPHIFEPLTSEELQDREAIGRRIAQNIEEVQSNPELAGDLEFLFTRSLLQNSDFESLFFAPLLDFFESIVTGGTILSMPWLEFDVPAGESALNLVVEAKDVLQEEVFKLTLPPITVISEQETILPLSQLVHWPSQGRSPSRGVRARPGQAPTRRSEKRRAKR